MLLESTKTSCPYCGELIELLYEPMEDEQKYIEDCQVCCQPILVKVHPIQDSEFTQFSCPISCHRSDESG